MDFHNGILSFLLWILGLLGNVVDCFIYLFCRHPELALDAISFITFNFIKCPFSFYDSAFSASLHCTVGTDTPLKRETEKAPATASESIAIDYHPSNRFFSKNDKLAMLRQSRFFNAHHSFQSALQMLQRRE